jgi:hypothetical protein
MIGLDDSLRASAYVIIDSVRVVVSDRGDTIKCDWPRKLYYPENTSIPWLWGRLSLTDLHSDKVNLSMVVWLVVDKDQVRQRHEVFWSGRLKEDQEGLGSI